MESDLNELEALRRRQLQRIFVVLYGHLRSQLANARPYSQNGRRHREEGHVSLLRRKKHQLTRLTVLHPAPHLQPEPQTGRHQQHYAPVTDMRDLETLANDYLKQ